MNTELLIEVVKILGYVVLGFIAFYFKKSEKLKEAAVKLIKEAEFMFKDVTQSGGSKFEYVVDTLYSLVPSVFKLIMSRDMIKELVQNTFNEIEEYATKQVDKVVDDIVKK